MAIFRVGQKVVLADDPAAECIGVVTDIGLHGDVVVDWDGQDVGWHYASELRAVNPSHDRVS